MKINADLSRPALVDSSTLPWIPSPLAGVERRMLERDGEEVARVTSIVRYAPESSFAPHIHSGGEEFIVLEGTFSDEAGDFPTGTYVRNPVGSRHAPHSADGTVIFVKLWWMHAGDQEFVRIDTTREDLWRSTSRTGIEIMPLHRYEAESAALYRLSPGAMLPARELPGGEEIFVLDGACTGALGLHGTGTWIRSPIGHARPLAGAGACRLYVKRGHFATPPPGPEAA